VQRDGAARAGGCAARRRRSRGPHPSLSQADTGLFNNWDRLPFTPRKDAAHVDLHEGNVLFANFNSFSGFDTDDCSAYHLMRNNVQVYGHGLKSDFSGHDVFFDNFLAVWGAGSDQYQPLVAGFENGMTRSTLLAASEGEVVMSHICPNATQWPAVNDTAIFTPLGAATICGQSIPFWQAAVPGVLAGVTARPFPADWTAAAIVEMARETLAGRGAR